MNKKYWRIKNKIVNRLILNGNKNTSEKLFLKTFKKLQISSLKQTKKIVQLSLINAMPIFKITQSSNKKIKKSKRKVRIAPVFIQNKQHRTALSIKFILLSIKKKIFNNYFYSSLTNEILVIAKNRGVLPEIKIETQKKVLKNKRYMRNYRW